MGAFGVPKDATGGRVAPGGAPAGRSFFGAGPNRNESGGGTGKHRGSAKKLTALQISKMSPRQLKAAGVAPAQARAAAKAVKAANLAARHAKDDERNP